MLVEFLTICTNERESYEKQLLNEKYANMELPQKFFNEEDIVTKRVIDMKTVVDFREGRNYLNDELVECVYVRHDPMYEMWSSVVLISYTEFKKIFQTANKVGILSYEDFKDIKI